MQINLSPELEKAVKAAVAGGYESPEHYIADAIRNYYQLKITRLDAALAAGFDQLERGETVGVEDVDTYFDELEHRIDQRLKRTSKDG